MINKARAAYKGNAANGKILALNSQLKQRTSF